MPFLRVDLWTFVFEVDIPIFLSVFLSFLSFLSFGLGSVFRFFRKKPTSLGLPNFLVPSYWPLLASPAFLGIPPDFYQRAFLDTHLGQIAAIAIAPPT